MARPTERFRLTNERIRKLAPPTDRTRYTFDTDPKNLCVRVTPGGAKVYVFGGKLAGAPLRITIGDVADWTLESARAEARRLATLIDQKIDPRIEKAEQTATNSAKRDDLQRRAATFADAWGQYIEARKPSWGERHLFDHQNLIRPGGEKWKRGKRRTNPGPLASLMHHPLAELDAERLKSWMRDELAQRATQTRIAFGALRAFVNWCADTPAYAGIVAPAIFEGSAVRAMLPKKAAKKDCLQREQLRAWFAAVRGIENPTIAAYLQGLLLTGARREELAGLTWANVDFKWQALTIRDKVDGERTIPLTPYVATLLRGLQGRNVRPLRLPAGKRWEPSPWVFASPTAKDGRIAEPRLAHNRALRIAGLDGLTLHGLRRSFGTLAEWVECPAGVVAQIMGHKPSATAEKHYRQRPLDLLRLWHQRIEAWMLAEAGIEFDPEQAAPKPEIHAVDTAA